LIISRVGLASDQVAQNPKKMVGSSVTMGMARQKTHKFRSQAKVGPQSQCNNVTLQTDHQREKKNQRMLCSEPP
jgi:hypothetical protein